MKQTKTHRVVTIDEVLESIFHEDQELGNMNAPYEEQMKEWKSSIIKIVLEALDKTDLIASVTLNTGVEADITDFRLVQKDDVRQRIEEVLK